MLRIKDIIERLDEDIILKSVLCEENQRIRGVKLLTDRITVFDSDILYIGRYESMINVSGGHYPMNVMIPENPSFPEHPDIKTGLSYQYRLY